MHRFPLLFPLLLFWALSLRHLAIIPPVYEDEPWQASTGWKIAKEGVFGSDLFSGLEGMERRYYGYMPLHPLLLAVVFRGMGVGLFQARFEAVALGLLVLALTGSLALRLARGRMVALVAMFLLLTVRLTEVSPSLRTGIVLLDVTRIARYDMLATVLGLASVHAYLSARTRERTVFYVAPGLLVSLAGLAHLHGLFWLPALLLFVIWDCRQPRRSCLLPLLALMIGFLLPWLGYASYVLNDVAAWRGQTRLYGERFQILELSWYLSNLLRERDRYLPAGSPLPYPWRWPGFWIALAGLPLAWLWLARRALRGDVHARLIAIPTLIVPLQMALFIYLKLTNYLVAIVPLFAITGACALVELTRSDSRARWARPLFLVLLVIFCTEGTLRWAMLEREARATTPYATFIARIRTHVPADARIVGLHHYWFGMEDYDYRSLLVPAMWGNPYHEARPLPLDEALDLVAPDIVLVDPRFRDYLARAPSRGDEADARFAAWLARHRVRLAATVDDPTYGRMDIYRVSR